MIVKNRILSSLPKAEYARLRPELEEIGLQENAILFGPGQAVRYVYFPNDSVVSLLYEVDTHRSVEVAMEGNEAAVGFPVHLSGEDPGSRSMVRVAGTAMRLDVRLLQGCSASLTDLLHRSAGARVTQIVQAGLCNRFHCIDARLARWLLMTHDRVGSPRLHATQASIACMLGVRRSGITTAAAGLQQQGLIVYRRGQIDILDPSRLRAASCACYGIIQRRYDSYLT